MEGLSSCLAHLSFTHGYSFVFDDKSGEAKTKVSLIAFYDAYLCELQWCRTKVLSLSSPPGDRNSSVT